MSSSATKPTPSAPTGPLGGGRLLAAAMALAVAVAAGAVVFTGASKPQQLLDAGAIVRWGIALFKPAADVAMAATIGFTGLGAFLVAEGHKTMRVARIGRWASISAALWFGATLVVSYLSYGDLAGIPVGSRGYTGQWWSNTWQLEILRNPMLTATAALVIAVVCWWHSSRTSLAWMTALGLLALWPIALSGHAAGSSDHETAVDSLIMHLVPVTLWVGGLIALGVMWGRLGKAAAASVRRYSSVATWCVGFVAFSGVLASTLRVPDLSQYVTTRYGLVIVAKALCLVVLGALGLMQRRRVVAVLERDATDRPSKALFARLALVEALVMGATMGLAAALARSAPPSGQVVESADPVVALTGYPAPPALTPANFFSQWRIEWLMTTFAVIAIVQYVRWAVRLHRRGDHWPIHRTILWVLAWLVFIVTIDSGAGVYGRVMMSVHMAGHMAISMTVPILLVMAAPVTLMLRAWPKRSDGTRGPREVLLSVVHSRYLNVVANPAVSSALFFVSLIVFYYTPIFELALRTHTGHILMNIHFLVSGYLFAWALIGIDPGPKKWPAPLRLLVLLITITFHAFFGVAMMTGSTLLAPSFFTALHYVSDPLRDQQAAGTITWGSGEGPTFLLAMVVAAQWYRSDRIEGQRAERRAERDGDAELKAYNAYLASRGGQGGQAASPGQAEGEEPARQMSSSTTEASSSTTVEGEHDERPEQPSGRGESGRVTVGGIDKE